MSLRIDGNHAIRIEEDFISLNQNRQFQIVTISHIGGSISQSISLQLIGHGQSLAHALSGFPLFPLCMLGGLVIQVFLDRFRKIPFVPLDHALMQRLSGTALDFLVVSAISTIRLEIITARWLPFLLIVTGGIIWNVFCVMFLARRVLPDAWFERAIAEMGQSMGVTATGLLLLRAVDPENETAAPSAFGYKQLLHEPFMGGGLWTSMAIPLVMIHGGMPVFLLSAGVIAAWLLVLRVLRKRS